MNIGFLTAHSGTIRLSNANIEQLLASNTGLEWEVTLFDGGIDPLYCRTPVKITQFDRELETIEGTMVYNGEPRKFSGEARDHIGKERVEYYVKFTEPAAELSSDTKNNLVQRFLNFLRGLMLTL